MKTTFDVKSLVIGLVVGLTLTALFGLASKPANSAPTVTTATGRFQCATCPGHAFVLDTQTGQVWEKFESDSQGSDVSDFGAPKTSVKAP